MEGFLTIGLLFSVNFEGASCDGGGQSRDRLGGSPVPLPRKNCMLYVIILNN